MEAGKIFGSVESVKAVSDLYSPVSGTVTAVNEELKDAPEKVNADANATWMLKVELKDAASWKSCCRRRTTEVCQRGDRTLTMRYLPKSPSDREEMLAAINESTPGVDSIDALFATSRPSIS